MYRKIIVGYDGSDQAKDALALGKDIAQTTGAELSVGGVFLFHPLLRSGIDPLDREAKQEFAERLEHAADSVGAPAQPVQSSSPGRGLHELAEEIEADLIVVGSSKHGPVGQTILGNVGVALMHGSPCAVAIAPRGYADQPDRGISTIVVGYDGSPESRLALEAASELSRVSGASLKLVAAAQPPDIVMGKSGGANYSWEALKETVEEQVGAQLEDARNAVPDDIKVEATVVSAAPAEALADVARTPGSILVLGSRAYGPLRRVLLGSVSRALAGSTPAPLIVHPRGMHEEPKAEPTVEAGATA
jgi:nucleotide-binding universal stress UspA family protein